MANEAEFVKGLSDALKQPQFYIALKASRYGLDRTAIETAIAGDQAACEKIASDLNQDAKAVWREFIGQLSRWKGTFKLWNVPTSPEEMVITSLRNIMAQRFVGKTVRLAVFISMDKTKVANSAQSAKFRWIQLMVEPDNPGKPWQVKRVIHWGTAPQIEFGLPYNVVLEEKGEFTTLKELALSDKALPDPIPGDIRARCRLIALGQPYTRRGTGPNGAYELEGIYVTLLVDNGDGSSHIVEGSSLKPEAWQKAPHGTILNTTITEKANDRGVFINIGDWHEAKNQDPIPYPKDIGIEVDLSDDAALRYMEDFVIYDGLPGKYWVAEGEKGPVFLLTIESFFSPQATVRILESADIDQSIIKQEGSNTRFDAPRIRALVKIQQYQKNDKVRLSRTAYAIWPVDETEAEESVEEIVLPSSGKNLPPSEKKVPLEPPVVADPDHVEPAEPESLRPTDKVNYAEDPLLDNFAQGVPPAPVNAPGPVPEALPEKPFTPIQGSNVQKDPAQKKPDLMKLGAPLKDPEEKAEKTKPRRPRFLAGEMSEETVL